MLRPTPCNFRSSVNANEDTRTESARQIGELLASRTSGTRVATSRVTKQRVGVWAILTLCGALGACSSSDPGTSSDGSGATTSTAGTTGQGGATTTSGGATGSAGSGVTSAGSTAAGGTTSAVAGANSGGASASGAGGSPGTAGNSAGGSTTIGGAGGMSGGGTGTGGASGSDGGLGGTINQYGTIVDSPAVAKLLALTKNCTAANKIASDTNKFATDSGSIVHVCALPGVAGSADAGGAIFWNADMDIDCDGVTTTNCPGTGANKDPSYYYQTSFAGPNSAMSKDGPALSAEKTPYVVIPDEITNVDQNNGGNIVAVIYKNQIEFAVFGDQIEYQKGDANEPIGEASVRTAVGLDIPASPASGGVSGGVTYIAFTGKGTQPKDMEDVAEIQALGTKLLESLLANNP